MADVINTKKEFIDLLFDLLDDNDADEWENETVYSFIQALAAWLNDADGYYKNTGSDLSTEQASWQLFADAFQAAHSYE